VLTDHRSQLGTTLPLRTLAELDLTAKLPPMQLCTARLIACGVTNPGIARRTHLKENTVKTHIARAMHVTGCQSRAHLVTWLYETGYLIPHPAVPSALNALALAQPSEHTTPTTATPDPSLYRIRKLLLAALTDVDHALNRPA